MVKNMIKKLLAIYNNPTNDEEYFIGFVIQIIIGLGFVIGFAFMLTLIGALVGGAI